MKYLVLLLLYFQVYSKSIAQIKVDTLVNEKQCVPFVFKFTGKDSIQIGGEMNEVNNFQLVATNKKGSIDLGMFELPIKVAYNLSVVGEISKSITISLCTTKGLDSLNDVQINFKYNVISSNLKVRDLWFETNNFQHFILKKIFPEYKFIITCKGPLDDISRPLEEPILDSNQVIKCLNQTLVMMPYLETGNPNYSSFGQIVEAKIIGRFSHKKRTKYISLGTQKIGVSLGISYDLEVSSDTKINIEACTRNATEINKYIDLPINLSTHFSKQLINCGKNGIVYLDFNKKQYKILKFLFKKCLEDGSYN